MSALPVWCYQVPWLTVRQPWADLVMSGLKDVENRPWPPPSTLPQWGRCSECPTRVPPTSRLRHRDSRHLHARLLPNPPGPCGPVEWTEGPFPFRLGIHAAAKMDDDADLAVTVDRDHAAVSDLPWYRGHVRFGPALGVLLGSVQMNGCHHAHECQEWDDDDLDDAALYCSDWAEPDVYHWTLSDPEPLPEPVPWKGRQGLWRIDREAA